MGTLNHSFDEEFKGDEPSDIVEHQIDERFSVEQLQRLVQLLDKSDVSEVELKRVSGDMRLVLRKAKADYSSASLASSIGPQQGMNGAFNGTTGMESAPVVETRHQVKATLVGIFHPWAKPKGGMLVAVGDKVKTGQLVGTIQSLNVINEVETKFAGRVVEILVQEGQPVEYGQPLMTIDSAE